MLGPNPVETETAYDRDQRLDKKFHENGQVLSPDEFSYAIFQDYLNNKPSGITGKDAVRYIGQINSTSDKCLDKTIRTKFIKLIWDNTRTKSKDLLKCIDKLNYFNPAHMPYVTSSDSNHNHEFSTVHSPHIKIWNSNLQRFRWLAGLNDVSTFGRESDGQITHLETRLGLDDPLGSYTHGIKKLIDYSFIFEYIITQPDDEHGISNHYAQQALDHCIALLRNYDDQDFIESEFDSAQADYNKQLAAQITTLQQAQHRSNMNIQLLKDVKGDTTNYHNKRNQH